MPVLSLKEWNQYISKFPEAHFMQTGEWGELKAAFGWDAVRIVIDSAGAQILFRKLPFGLTIAYLPKGPIGENPGDIWPKIDQTCHEHHAIFLKVEPDAMQTIQPFQTGDFPGFTISHYNIQPPNTIIVNMGESESDLLQKMHQKTRYNIKLAARKEVIVQAWNDIPAFHKMMTATGGRDGFGVHSQEYYQRAYDLFSPAGMCELLVARYGNQPLASIMVFARGKRAWYVYGASTDLERNRMPAYLLQWEAMRWATKRGCLEYDLWGIPDETEETLEADFINRNSGLWGVYRFKRGFGGEVKRSVQALDKVYIPFLYSIYLRRMAGREAV
jgi:lipid II:glycine glycyltransferase (peptidoglycan interpeptide bridge formation enzyme)